MRRLFFLALLLAPALACARIPGAMFYLMDTPKSMASFEAHAGKIGVVVPTWYHVDESGLVSGEPNPLVMQLAKQHRMRLSAGTEFRIPLSDTLTWSLSGRLDKYRDASSADIARTWGTAIEWRPLQGLLLRGTYGTNFHAPDMQYLYKQDSLSTKGIYSDYYQCIAANQSVCPAIQHTTYYTLHAAGGHNLLPEEGHAWTYGFVWDVNWVEGLSVSADYWHMLRSGENKLEVHLHSPIARLQPWLLKQPYALPGEFDSAFGDEPKGKQTANYIRKANYQYGWDWGPRYVTLGIWQPVRLENWDEVRLSDFHIAQQHVDADLAQLQAETSVQADQPGKARLTVSWSDPDGSHQQASQEVELRKGDNALSLPIRIEHPRRWWPTGYGAQDMLDVLVMPCTGPVRLQPGEREYRGTNYRSRYDGVPATNAPAPSNQGQPATRGYRSRYDAADEHARPGYYQVRLKDYDVLAELTATLRAGLHRYTFHGKEEGHLLVDFAHGFHDDPATPTKVTDASLRLVGKDTLVGSRRVHQWANNRYIHFAMGFDRGVTLLGGFPFPICTPAHGTAYDIAGLGVANVGATRAALLLAARMAWARRARRAPSTAA